MNSSAPFQVRNGVRTAILPSRMETVARKMQNTLFRMARSGILNTAHDFSCVILTADCRTLAAAESLPVHTLVGPDLMDKAVKKHHPALSQGDCFLHNSPYKGNSHAADHCLIVPAVVDDGVLRFFVLAKAHQADCSITPCRPTPAVFGGSKSWRGKIVSSASRATRIPVRWRPPTLPTASLTQHSAALPRSHRASASQRPGRSCRPPWASSRAATRATDGTINAAKGARGEGSPCRALKRELDDSETVLPACYGVTLAPGERVISQSSGGYCSPLDRDLARVLHDLREGWISAARAFGFYGVVTVGSVAEDSLAVNKRATEDLRAFMRPAH